MKKVACKGSIVAFVFLLGLTSAFAGNEKGASEKPGPVGFVDENKDGINDRFRDSDGNGINDVDGKPYRHKFLFVDKDKDGVNDVWQDRDGDGVNDHSHKLGDKDRSNVDKCLLDADNDGRNDITGLKYKKDDFMGHKFGFMDEKSGKVQGRFMDEDGNGIDDRMEPTRARVGQRNRDFFIDEDGDGICDGRDDALQRQSRERRRSRRGSQR